MLSITNALRKGVRISKHSPALQEFQRIKSVQSDASEGGRVQTDVVAIVDGNLKPPGMLSRARYYDHDSINIEVMSILE